MKYPALTRVLAGGWKWCGKCVRMTERDQDGKCKDCGNGLKADEQTPAISKILVEAGHDTIQFFSKQKDYDKALADLKKHVKRDKVENGQNGDWQQVGSFDRHSTKFESRRAAEDWAYENVHDYAAYALECPDGWLFAADIHI